jgi:GTP-binding protein
MFIDEAIITVRSGDGGDGAVHFRREKYVPRGGPDGGDGGRGGDIVLEVRPTLNTLVSFRHATRFPARNGGRGGKQNQTGKSADELVIYLPPGTLVSDHESGEVLGDLVDPGQRLLVCKGGRGGRGNARFATPTHQAPRIAEKGEPGKERTLKLVLKLIADIGIIGAPNAGKSTLLAALTDAKPKIAPYPFTTLEPNLGVAILDEDTTLVLADIPGLIEGAHRGVGLGHDFLRHIQRTQVLIHLLDGEASDPLLDFAQINSELSLFDPDLAAKPQIVALNKLDLPQVRERWPYIEAAVKERLKKESLRGALPSEPMAVSALAGTGVRTLLQRAAQALAEMKRHAPEAPIPQELPVYRPATDPRSFNIQRLPEGWKVSGEAIERAAAMTYWEYDDSIRRFQRILSAIGVEEALRKAGVKPGDTVRIGKYELEWED